MFDHVVGVRDIFLRLLFVRALVMRFVVLLGGFFRAGGEGSLDDSRNRRLGRRRYGGLVMLMVVMLVAVIVVFMGFMTFVVMMLRFRSLVMMLGVFTVLRRLVPSVGWSLGPLGVGVLDDLAPDAVAAAAAAGIAMARAATAVTVLVLFLGLAMGALVGLDQGLTVGDRDLVVVGMDFAEGEEAVAVAAIFDEGRLQRRFYPRDLREVDIAAQLFALGGLEIKLFDAIAADHDDPGLFRVGGIDQHLVGHFGTLGGGGRVGPGAQDALSGDATVHLIRG